MQTIPNGAANVNLRGKKSQVMACGCCVAQNFKERNLKRDAMKEMRAATTQTYKLAL